jgi:hypothetical protein
VLGRHHCPFGKNLIFTERAGVLPSPVPIGVGGRASAVKRQSAADTYLLARQRSAPDRWWQSRALTLPAFARPTLMSAALLAVANGLPSVRAINYG